MPPAATTAGSWSRSSSWSPSRPRSRSRGLPSDEAGLQRLKSLGFSDPRLAELSGKTAAEVALRRRLLGVAPVYKRVDTCAAEFPTQTSYMYSSYDSEPGFAGECEAWPSDRTKVVILGGGPNRIGQGIEFDYCCVHAAYALKEAGFEAIMVNCNPETVSTDYDTSDRLYFEPLTAEDVIELIRAEQRNGKLLGVIVQFGGQTPLKLAQAIEAAQIPILGTSPDAIDLAEDRQRFQALLHRLGLRQPANGTAISLEEAKRVAGSDRLPAGRPPVLRAGRPRHGHPLRAGGPRPVLRPPDPGEPGRHRPGGEDLQELADPARPATSRTPSRSMSTRSPTASDVYIAGVMQHVEEAGVHSGDSACSLPPHTLSDGTDRARSSARRANSRWRSRWWA